MLLARYPGLVGELSYRPGLVCDGEHCAPEWRDLLLKHPPVLVIGSDTWVNQRWQHYEAQMRDYRTWLGGLPADVAQRVAWGNAAALLGCLSSAQTARTECSGRSVRSGCCKPWLIVPHRRAVQRRCGVSHLEGGRSLRQTIGLLPQALRGNGRLFHQRGVLLGGLVELGDGVVHQGNAVRLLAALAAMCAITSVAFAPNSRCSAWRPRRCAQAACLGPPSPRCWRSDP